MNKKVYDISSAFRSLNEMDDLEVKGMLINEAKSYDLNSTDAELEEAKELVDAKKEDETEIEVIDADADTVDHLKNKEDYVGQGILVCNKCKAKKFVDMNKLVADEEDPEKYNVEDECPNCHSEGYGYELMGQVGKVKKPAEEETANVDNDEKEEVGFDNDLEDETNNDENNNEPFNNEGEENNEESSNELKFDDEETYNPDLDLNYKEKDGMETTSSEDEENDLDLPELGDDYDNDDKLTDEDDDEVSESFKQAIGLREDVNDMSFADKAWLMNKVIMAMNDEEAYYGGWLYIWPDEETREECEDDFGDADSFEDLKESFIETYKEYHDSGLFNPDEETLAYAREWDEKLGLGPIDAIYREAIEEAAEEDEVEEEEIDEDKNPSVSDFLDSILDVDKVETITISNIREDESEEKIFEGTFEEIPAELLNSEIIAYDVSDLNLVVNVGEECDNPEECDELLVEDILDYLDDEKTENIIINDTKTSEVICEGTADKVIKKCGNYIVDYIEVPNLLNLYVSTEDAAVEPAEEEAPVEESLFENICKFNNLKRTNINRINSDEYWINESINSKEDLGLIFSRYVEGKNSLLEMLFKQVTGFKTELDIVNEKYDTHINEAFNNKEFEEFMSLMKKLGYKYLKDAVDAHPGKKDQDLLAALRDECKDKGLCESLNEEFVSKLSQEALDDIEEIADRFNESLIKESVQHFTSKQRKELAAAIEECKKHDRPYSVKRSLTEGYRYDLITEAKLDEFTCLATDADAMEYARAYAKENNIFPNDPDYKDYLEEYRHRYWEKKLWIHPDFNRENLQYYLDADKEHLGDLQARLDKQEAERNKELEYRTRFFNKKNESLKEDIEPVAVLVPENPETIVAEQQPAPAENNCVEATAREVMAAYQNANKWLDSVKEVIYTDLNCPFFSSYVHNLAHTMPARFDKFGDILHTVNMEIPYPETAEIASKPQSITQAFEVIFNTLDAIKVALNNFIKCTDEEQHGMSCAAETCLNDIEAEYPMLFRLRSKAQECSEDTTSFDKYVMQYVEHKDDLLESLEPVQENLYDKLLAYRNDKEDSYVDFDEKPIVDDLNKYFDEAYESTMTFECEDGTINEAGEINLMGNLILEEEVQPITFTLTPRELLKEGVNEEAIHKIGYIISNNISDEKFEYRFDNNTHDKEIFEFNEGKADKIIKDFEKEYKVEFNPEMFKDVAEWEYARNKDKYAPKGLDASHIENKLRVGFGK